jgi:transglutaminase-like putative cysteine protease
MVQLVKGQRGEHSVYLRSLTEQVTRGLQPKDYLGELLAVRNFCAERIRYMNDPLTLELVKDPQRLAEEVVAKGKAVGDCDDIAAFSAAMLRQLGREAQFVTVGFGRPGHYSHVFTRVKEPKSQRWYVCDPVAGTDEGTMLRRVKTYRFWTID